MVGDSSDEPAPAPPSTPPDTGGGIGEASLDLGYTVTVDSFSGPLDLLLYLVRRTELDILEVPLSLIVDQFVDTVRSWQDADLDVAGEFILMAATLLELKARTIAPPLEATEEGGEDEPMFDPRESLLRSLLAYRRFKEAAQGLNELEEARRPLLERQMREHVPEAPPEDTDIDLGEIDLNLLATTCERILSRIGGLGPRTVVVDEMPLGVRIATLLDELGARERATINELLAGNTSRVVHITTVMATLELARQRFVEVQQPEQFGDIALRLRSAEERERAPELPPPDPEGAKRRRGRLPLVTWHAPAGTGEQAPDDAADATPEEVVESDEQRFLRELEESTRVTAVLAITADVEKSFTDHWYTLHPELKPAPTPVAAPEIVPASVVKRLPPKRRASGEIPAEVPPPALPAADAGAATPPAAATEVVAAPPADAPAAETTPAAQPAAEAATTPPIAPTPAAAEEVVVAVTAEATAPSVLAETSAAGSSPPVVDAPAPPPAEPSPPLVDLPAAVAAAPVAETPAVDASVAVVVEEQPAASTVAETPSAPVVASPASVEPPASVDTSEPQAVLPVEQWPVLHAQPVPEEAPHPLDTIASDDPAAVNAALGGQPERPPRTIADEVEDEDEEEPDELLADDPALVNAALLADTPRPPAGRRAESDVIIPAATETSVWTAPVDRGQTASGFEDEVAAGGGEQPASDERPAGGDGLSAVSDEQLAASDERPTASDQRPPVGDERPMASDEQPVAADDALSEAVLPPSPEQADAEPAAAEADDLEPADQEPFADPALVEASRHADAPRSVDPHPVHELTIPTATGTSVWTAPVDHGQTAALVDDDDESAVTVSIVPPVGMVAEAAVVEPPAPSSPAVAAPAPLAPPPGDRTSPSVPPLPSTPAPAAGSAAPPVVDDSAGAAPASAPMAPAGRIADAPPPDAPPPVAPPPPPPAPPATRSDSSNPAPATTPQPESSPMSPPPRSRAWLLIAIFIAINAAWAGAMWWIWVPRDILEVDGPASIQRSQPPVLSGQPRLVWRFNLDVVDDLGMAKAPEVVPRISPAIPGRWQWLDRRTLAFDPAGDLPLASDFTTELDAERMRTVHGFRLRQTYADHWTTPELTVSGLTVETFDRDSTTIALSFNQPVDPVLVAQHLRVDVPLEAADVPVAAAPAPAADTTTVALPAASREAAGEEKPVAGESQAATTPSSTDAVAAPATPAPGTPVAAPPSPAKPQVTAITTAPAATVRLRIATAARGPAGLWLAGGGRLKGVAGPLGLAATWNQVVPLKQTLSLAAGRVEVPSHGDVRIEVEVSDRQAPRELLAPVVTVEPAVPVTVSTTDAGLALTGAFVPGETYRIRSAATWPDEPSTSGHVLPAYTAASEVAVAVPSRPPGIWPGDGEVIDGRARFAAHAVERADVMLVTGEDECVASRELVWDGSEASPLDLEDLTEAQPAGAYRLRVRSQDESSALSEQTLHIDEVRVRPQALLAALSDWLLAGLAGEEQADVRVRVVRLANH